MIDSVGLSTLLTYVVPTRRSRHDSPSVSGLMLAEITSSMSGTTSGLSMTEQHDLSATIAVSLMIDFGSCDTSISLRTISGRLAVTDLGASLAHAARSLTADMHASFLSFSPTDFLMVMHTALAEVLSVSASRVAEASLHFRSSGSLLPMGLSV